MAGAWCGADQAWHGGAGKTGVYQGLIREGGNCAVRLTLTALAVTLAIGAALAQTTPGTTRPAAPIRGADASTGAPIGVSMTGRNTGTAAADGDRTQAVATTYADAVEPARWISSFTEGEARGRSEDEGHTSVTNLVRGDDGVWCGPATRGRASVQVWLDCKGNAGQGAGAVPAVASGMAGTSR